MEQQQKLVDSLHNMVVVVDDTNSESGESLEMSFSILYTFIPSLSKQSFSTIWTEQILEYQAKNLFV